ncbi:MAG: hypothetical protein ACKVQA_06990 [Burkholderiales bacterium]
MITRLIFGIVFVGAFAWLIGVVLGRWADREVARHQDELARSERFRQLSPEAPRAAGLRSERKAVGR